MKKVVSSIKKNSLFCICTTLLSLSVHLPAFAQQVIPDKSFGTQSSIREVSENINFTDIISGGKKQGNTVFHSFGIFNLNKDQKVLFKTDQQVQNVITRVTNERSVLNGSIFLPGIKRFVFINSNGISVNRDFKFNSTGSLFLSTSSKLNWGSKDFLSSTNHDFFIQETPKFLEFTMNDLSREINIRNFSFNSRLIPFIGNIPIPKEINNLPQGINIATGNDLLILASSNYGDNAIINLDSSNVFIYAIESGKVKFYLDNNNIEIRNDYQPGEINLKNNSNINSYPNQKGNINILTGKLNLEGGSFISSFRLQDSNKNFTPYINIQAQSFRLSGVNPESPIIELEKVPSSILSFSAISSGADIHVEAQNVDLEGGARVYSVSTGSAKAGNLTFNATEDLNVSGFLDITQNLGLNNNPLHGIISVSGGNSSAGLISLSSPNINLNDSANVAIYTTDNALSNTIQIKTTELNVSGYSPIFPLAAQIQTGSSSEKAAGDIIIESEDISLKDGAGIGSSSVGKADTGTISINAKSVTIDGKIPNTISRSRIFSAVQNQENEIFEIILENNLAGNSKSIFLNANSLNLLNEAEISVKNDGLGDSGTLNIDANLIKLENKSQLTASTANGQGGNIAIKSSFLKINNSDISVSSKNNGLGGNITIESPLIALTSDSKIEANAEQNQAGQVNIITNALLSSNGSEIRATSALGPQFDGSVEFDPNQIQISFLDTPFIDNTPAQLSLDVCTNDGSTISDHGIGKHFKSLEDKRLYAEDLRQRLAIADQFVYTDTETGELVPFRRWLGIQQKDDGNLEIVFSPDQSKVLQDLLSSDTSRCSQPS